MDSVSLCTRQNHIKQTGIALFRSWIIWHQNQEPSQTQTLAFLAVDDEVPLLVPCCDGIDDTISVWVLGQDGGDEGVGASVLGDKRPVSAEKVQMNERESRTIQTGGGGRIVNGVKSISSLIRLLDVTAA